MRPAALAIGLVLAASTLWFAGETHRSNCIDSGRKACSVLPWDNGQRTARSFDFQSGR